MVTSVINKLDQLLMNADKLFSAETEISDIISKLKSIYTDASYALNELYDFRENTDIDSPELSEDDEFVELWNSSFDDTDALSQFIKDIKLCIKTLDKYI